MGQFSITHLLLLSIIALIFFGPNRLPALGQSLGKAIRGFKQGLNEIDAEAEAIQEARPLNAGQQQLNGQSASHQIAQQQQHQPPQQQQQQYQQAPQPHPQTQPQDQAQQYQSQHQKQQQQVPQYYSATSQSPTQNHSQPPPPQA